MPLRNRKHPQKTPWQGAYVPKNESSFSALPHYAHPYAREPELLESLTQTFSCLWTEAEQKRSYSHLAQQALSLTKSSPEMLARLYKQLSKEPGFSALMTATNPIGRLFGVLGSWMSVNPMYFMAAFFLMQITPALASRYGLSVTAGVPPGSSTLCGNCDGVSDRCTDFYVTDTIGNVTGNPGAILTHATRCEYYHYLIDCASAQQFPLGRLFTQ